MTTVVARPALPHDPHPSTPTARPGLVLLTVCFGYFMGNWAMAPASSILPTISRDLDLSVPAAGWVMSAYFLTLVGLVLVMGRLGDLLGHARVFGMGAVAFTIGELICGLSTSFPMLLVGRAVQGVGSAAIFGTSLAIIAAAIPTSMRGLAIGLLTVAAAGASLIGVAISTWAVENLNWHFAFLIPLPVGLVAATMGFRMRLPAPQMASRQIDWAGAALLFATITAAMLGLNHLHDGPETFEAGAPYHAGMHVLAIALFVAFIKVEQRAKAPLLGFKLLRIGKFSSEITANGIAHMSMLATTFLLPFLLERGRGLSPAETRTVLMAQLVAMIACSLLAGYVYDRARSPVLGVALMASIVGGLFLYGLGGGSLPYLALLGVAALLGASLGGFTTVNNTAIMSMAPQDQRGFASGFIELTRQFGHTVGVSLSSSILGAALAGQSTPSYDHYVAGFQQAALTMGLLSSLGVVALLWPQIRAALAGSQPRTTHPRPVAGGSE